MGEEAPRRDRHGNPRCGSPSKEKSNKMRINNEAEVRPADLGARRAHIMTCQVPVSLKRIANRLGAKSLEACMYKSVFQ